ncbi:MAG: prephenate dehydrogenase dimerization domain-containing protein, partial [Mycobacteriales bacterium]
PRVPGFLQVLSHGGAKLVTVDAWEHDRLTAVAQALTHTAILTFGLALGELEMDIEKLSSIAPPPHALMLALLARIASGAPEVYWDIQDANPLAAQARRALGNAVRRLIEVTETGTATDFAATLRQLRAVLGPELSRYRELCAQTFGGMTSPADSTR